jgi:protein gp37
MSTAIEWTDATWNPTTGCTKVSPACARCYIERTPPFRIADRRFVRGHIPLQLHEDRLTTPLHWKKPRRIFVDSMSDLFHEDVSDTFIMTVFETMGRTPRHTYQILTKRADRLAALVPRLPWAPHIWQGVTVENWRFLGRLAALRAVPVPIRFVSAEPLLGPLDLRPYLGTVLRWVIAGGESGPGARPMDPAWVRDLRDQCVAAGVAFFFKQWGGRTPKSGGRLLDGREWSQYPPRLVHASPATEAEDARQGVRSPDREEAREAPVTPPGQPINPVEP